MLGYAVQLKKENELHIGFTGVDLNALEVFVRNEETNISNWIADLIKYLNKSDVSMINGGGLRIDDVIPEGPITMGTVMKLLPIHEPIIVIRLTGKHILSLLENGVSAVGGRNGRFPCIGGIRFKYDQ